MNSRLGGVRSSEIGMRRPVPPSRDALLWAQQIRAVYLRSCQTRRYRPMNKNSMLYVGLDLGDMLSYITIVDPDGVLIEESRLPTTRASFQRKFATLQPCRVAMEVGAHSR